MKSDEFKSRQGWLAFTDAVGIVLEVMSKNLKNLALFKPFAFVIRKARTFKQPVQLPFNFLQQRSILEWADWRPEKNLQLFI